MIGFLQEFESHLKLNKHASANTLSSYVSDISRFIEYINLNGIQNIDKCDEKSISDYILYLKKQEKSTSTINRISSSLRAFFGYLFSSEKIGHDPTANLKHIKAVKVLPRILTVKEVDLFLSQPKCNTLKGCRDKAMLELLYATGIRVSELVSLNISDFNSLGFIRCKKESAERIISIYDTAISAVDNYIKKVRPLLLNNSEEEALFLNAGGTRMTRQGFWKIIKHYHKTSEIKTDITPHILRHSFATHLLENGADVALIKEMLGHSDVSSTLVYTRLIKSKLKDSHIKIHPRA